MTSPAPRPGPDDARLPIGPMSFEEFVAFAESDPETPYEYIGGYAYAKSGVTKAHNRISLNIAGHLWSRTRGTGCTTYMETFGIRTPSGEFYLPDVAVSCGPTTPAGEDYIDNPCLIIEVLSRSTRLDDFGIKREGYLTIVALGAYLRVESTWRAVHRDWRGLDGAWRTELVAGAEGVVPLPCPAGGVLTLDEIYEGTNVPPEPPESPRLHRVREEMAEYRTQAAVARAEYEPS